MLEQQMAGPAAGVEKPKEKKASTRMDIIKYCIAAQMPPEQLKDLLAEVEQEEGLQAHTDRYSIATNEEEQDAVIQDAGAGSAVLSMEVTPA
eukprot:4598610-Karenia_brevis.AAC.1